VSSFLATDCSGDQQIDLNEFRTLLWLITGDEPTSERMKNEICIIDANKDGSIQIREWLNYILPHQDDAKYGYFDFSLRRLFDSV
jgi:Ca2+-binding EF-hand superfamily protein